MRTVATVGLVVLVAMAGRVAGQDVPKPDVPKKEHEWLKQLEGEWVSECEMVMAPGQPAEKAKATESVRSLGGFWTVSELKMDLAVSAQMTGLMTIGYDAAKKKYVGTWVCSMCDWLCEYEGTVNGKVFTLECEGPNPADPTKKVKMRDVIEVKDKDHKVLTSSMLGEDGKWVPFMTMTSTRKK
jgi:hypothetical protein